MGHALPSPGLKARLSRRENVVLLEVGECRGGRSTLPVGLFLSPLAFGSANITSGHAARLS
jgi:hypothetical protein